MKPWSRLQNIYYMNRYAERIEHLRAFMRARDLDAVVIYNADPHLSEYPALRWKQVEWLTGFTGEAGDVVVTMDEAYLWTDSRYFIQAESQLDGTGIKLQKARIPGSVSVDEWLLASQGEGARVGVDSFCTSVENYKSLIARFDVVCIPDMLTPLWEERPGIAQTPIYSINPGESVEEKLDWLMETLSEKECDYIIISALDEIAWLLNVRASDIEYTPVVISYLLVGRDGVKWFALKDEIEDDKTSATIELLTSKGIRCLPYNEVSIEISSLEDALIWVDRQTLNIEIFSAIKCKKYFAPSPIQTRKAIKNPVEIDNMRETHLRDGVAMENFLHWLENKVNDGSRVSEWDAALKLAEFRRQIDDYVENSFETISAYGAGAALPHYHTPSQNAPLLMPSGMYLNDSGGQFLRGTTDITRTIPLGVCTELEKRDYTLVLKAHIDLASSVFPSGIPGCRLDAVAREALWKYRVDFGHGTGHGVGYFLGVHEGPAQIRQNLSGAGLFSGMIISIEPGVYREGMFGVRHENLYLIADAGESEFGHFLKFEPLTMCHFDTSILNLSLLDEWEIEWLDDYNRRVYESIGTFLDEPVRSWLREKTKPVK